jgi:hypothetical protein
LKIGSIGIDRKFIPRFLDRVSASVLLCSLEYRDGIDIPVTFSFPRASLAMTATKDEELTVSQSVNAFFEAPDEKSALKALRTYNGQPREKIRDLYNGVIKARVHDPRKGVALEVLSRADVLMGRIIRGRNWRLLRYLDPMLAAELWKALGDGGASFSMDAVPWPLRVRIWNDSKKLRDIGLAAARRMGTSQRGFLVEDMPYLLLLCREKAFREAFVKSLNLEENYAAFIEKESARKTAR